MFPDEEMRAFDDPGIVEFYKQAVEYEFWIDLRNGSAKRIGIKLHVDGRGQVHFRTSHHVHTPLQAGPYITSRTSESSLSAALDRAVESITKYYNEAIRAGHIPQSSWFVRNSSF